MKSQKYISHDDLVNLSKAALDQINEKEYETEMIAKGIKNILKYRIAFSRKDVEISME